MLCWVGDAWRREVPASALLARHGGDGVSLLPPRMTGPAALSLARRVYAANPDLALSCRVADRAFYEAKATARGRAALDRGVDPVPWANDALDGTTAPPA